ncbi:MFS transporter [Sphaerisporangium krabiense]|uniref:DHA2 family methylenomycin A resistance protein-like MFS transporter n=1 Tax=Sphaerisporangium krabiense TaxID=763782 RepID=A0A7W8YZ45_9ACTN|nr:MFS transporter [Sphaerisporangium krabiense]MBB5624347.1 DHA2 family methylenomycin A resistance protein-like MFS transporter [Sphaerisporangium krabiense]GII61702.1 MFS transporter [Sphaerisporangium krabiense]
MTTVISRADAAARRVRRPIVLVGISLGYFMVLLDMTVLSVAEPDLAASLHASIAGLQWATTGYTVVFGALLLSAGAVADRYGAHRVFRAGIVVFGLVSLLSATAPTLPVLVALRAVLGAAGAACVPASMALIAWLYPDPAARTRAVAAWAAISGTAVAAGPVAGGLLVDLAGWRAVFLVNVPLTVLVLALTAGRAIHSPRGDRRIHWPAQLAVCAALALLTDTLIAAGARSWGHAALSGTATVLAGVVFAVVERRSTAPVLHRGLLRGRGVRAALAAGAAVTFALNGNLFVLPLLFQREHGLSAVTSGLAFLPLTLPFVLNPPLTGRIVARVGPRPPILAGLGLLTAGGASLGWASWAGAGYGWQALGLLLTGFGVSFALPALVTAVLAAAPSGTAGAAGGLLNAVRQTGASLGVATMGSLAALPGGTVFSLLLAAAVCAAAAIWFARGTAS